MVDVSLFYSHFSSRKPVCNENERGVGHAVDPFVDAIDRRFSCSPLLNRDCGSLFEVRSARGKVLSGKDMALSFEDTLPSGTCIPGVSPFGGGGHDGSRLGVRI
jgi:hypothetical protein